MHTDSPGVPASASAYELFRGFSFVAPMLLDEDNASSSVRKTQGVAKSVATSGGPSSNTTVGGNSHNLNNNNNHSFTEPGNKGKNTILSKCKGRTLSEYEFHEIIGTGSFSVCKRCVHTTSQKEYAVKVSIQPFIIIIIIFTDVRSVLASLEKFYPFALLIKMLVVLLTAFFKEKKLMEQKKMTKEVSLTHSLQNIMMMRN